MSCESTGYCRAKLPSYHLQPPTSVLQTFHICLDFNWTIQGFRLFPHIICDIGYFPRRWYLTYFDVEEVEQNSIILSESESDHKSDCYNFNGIVLDLKEKGEKCKNNVNWSSSEIEKWKKSETKFVDQAVDFFPVFPLFYSDNSTRHLD